MASKILKAPEQFTKDEIYQEAVRESEKNQKVKKEMKEAEGSFYSQMTRAGTAIGTAVGGGLFFAKFPNLATLDKKGRFQTRLILGGVSVVGALATEDLLSDGFEGAAYGFGLPFLSDLGTKWGS